MPPSGVTAGMCAPVARVVDPGTGPVFKKSAVCVLFVFVFFFFSFFGGTDDKITENISPYALTSFVRKTTARHSCTYRRAHTD